MLFDVFFNVEFLIKCKIVLFYKRFMVRKTRVRWQNHLAFNNGEKRSWLVCFVNKKHYSFLSFMVLGSRDFLETILY